MSLMPYIVFSWAAHVAQQFRETMKCPTAKAGGFKLQWELHEPEDCASRHD